MIGWESKSRRVRAKITGVAGALMRQGWLSKTKAFAASAH
jgi:hypothetical protein